MTGVTNAELAAALQQVIAQVDAREDQLKAWQSGAADEGPYADGRFPIVNLLGEIGYFKSPARLAHEVGLLTSAADGALAQCLAAQATAQAAATLSETKANAAGTHAATATTKAQEADTFRQQAANSEANALVYRNQAATSATTATGAATVAEDAAGVAVIAKDDAETARDAAQAAAAAAATFNPNDFYTKVASDSRFLNLSNFTWANLDGKPSTFTPSAHGHIIADISGLQTALDGKQAAGSYVTTEGFTWSALAGKPTTFTPAAHTHVISDTTGLQTALDGKQPVGNYSLVGHGHVISDISGLQTALDGKQAAGSYVTTTGFTWSALSGKPETFTPSAHTHVIADVTGLQTALDGKQAAGSYVTTANFTWSNLSGKPSTFTPSAHTHIISDVTGLQTALDGKQDAGNYSLVGHGHVIADISGLQTALDGKQAAGSYVTTTNFTWANLAGKPSTFTPSTHTHAIGDVTGLATELTSKVTRRTGEVSFGIQTYGATAWAMDGVTGAGIGGWARHFSIKGGELDSHAGFFAVYGLNTQAGEVRIGVGTADNGYTQGNALRITSSEMSWNGAVVWHGGNFSPSSKSDVGHGHVISDISGLQTALDGKSSVGHTHSIGEVTGLQSALDGKQAAGSYAPTVHSHDYLPLSGGIVGGTLEAGDLLVRYSSGATWASRIAAPWEQPAEVLNMNENGFSAITFHVVNKYANLFGYDENNVLKSNNNTIWHSGNFDPNSKQNSLGYTPVNLAGDTMTGPLAVLSSVSATNTMVISGSGNLPYLDMQTSGVGGGRNYRIRSGIEGIANGGFSVRDLTSGANVLYILDNGISYIPAGVDSRYFGYNLTERFTSGGNSVAQYGLSAMSTGETYLSGYYGVSLMSGGTSRLSIDGAGTVSIPGTVVSPQINLGDSTKFIRGGAAGQTILGVADVNQAYVQVGNSYYSIWNAGNFDPNSKANASHTHAYLPLTGGTLTGNLAAADIYASRGDTTGVIYFGNQSGGGRWLYYDGSSYQLANTGLNVGGSLYANGNIGSSGGLTIDGGSPVYRSSWTNDFQSSSDFVNGTLVETDIPANVQHGESFEIEITGKSYSASNPPFKVIAQGYLYDYTIISTSGISYGGQFADNIKVMERNGVLCFWWPRISYWNSFRVSVVASMNPSNGTIARNRVTAITDIAEPSSSKKVTISLHRSIQTAPGGAANIQRPYSLLLNLFNDGGLGSRLQFADTNWSANILHNSGNLMLQTQGENTRMFLGNGVVGIGTGNTSDSSFRVTGAAGTDFRVGYNGLSQNYYDADNHYVRHSNGQALLHIDGGGVQAFSDLYAKSGNLFIRENPSGAGAGMRLHHNGGSGYVDFDGDLNFRTGEGNGLASLSSGGAFTASDISSVGNVRAGNTSGIGFTIMNAGTTGNPGYLSWYHPNGTRVGYMGWSNGGSNIVYQAEAGWGLQFNSTVTLAGQTNSSYQIRAAGWWNSNGGSATGLGVEIGSTSGNGYVYSYNRDASTYGPLRLGGSIIVAENAARFDSTASFLSTVDVVGGNLRINSGGGDSTMGAYISYRNNLGAERGWIGYGEGTSRMRVYNGIGSLLLQGHGTQIDSWGGGNTRISTTSGYLDVGPLNSGWCHFATDRAAFYFGQAVHFDGAPMRYNQGAVLHHGSSSLGSGVITVSTASPSGGSDGDIWIKVAS